ncbi:hypothetical protein MANES_17G038908v8 [Manihot esculenta]|uniref:Uncharacterized protein n=1 Tax=Manihot esculenta TaxID=3983 RepID=A0ACB7G2R5_MANES|nr:hypothetical protein MANES_17G038908v8 [Manihot esculenta]
MEVGLQVHKPLSCRAVFQERTLLNIKPFLGFFPRVKTSHFSNLTSGGNRYPIGGSSLHFIVAADFSKRRHRKISTAKSKRPPPKGFKPKKSAGASLLKRDAKNKGIKEVSIALESRQIVDPNKKILEIKPDIDEEQAIEFTEYKKVNKERTTKDASSISKKAFVAKSNQGMENGTVGSVECMSGPVDEITIEERQFGNSKSDSIVNENVGTDEKSTKDPSLKLKMEMEENSQKQEIEVLAEENFSRGNKLFVYPQLAKPDKYIQVYLNRSLSTLNNEPDVLIMGAFNEWRWKSFTMRLNKTHLKGDWWSCQVHVPKEAYKMDFVFFNGKNAYDNNDKRDFCIPIEVGMDAFPSDDFLLEEKCREQSERERRAEEQRQREEEKAASEADRAKAKVKTEKSQEILLQLMKNAARSVDNVWYIEPSEFHGGGLVQLYYNKSSGPLSHANDLWIHGGYNNWNDGLVFVEKLVKSERKEGDWWYANVVVPDQVLVLDWVFADGPPQSAIVYDNNQRQDFHAVVAKPIPEGLFSFEEEHQKHRKPQEERQLREEDIRAKAARTTRMKAERKERTLKRFLLYQKHILYTDPLDVQAGTAVTIFYNPANTILNGKSEVWIRCSFNHWTHHNGPLPPQKMLPADNGSHVKSTVKVPLDAYMMDLVFSEREDGGIFDNGDGMDYHIPVFGGTVKEPPMHIVHVAVEMAPIAKVGGLGDVITGISRAVQDLNHSVDIILPKYDCLNLSHVKDFYHQKSYSWGGTEIKVWYGKVEGLSVYFLEPVNGMFSTGCIYGCRNDSERFGFFCHAALEFLLQNELHPDIIHCHDWSSAPVAWLFKDHYMDYGLSKARVVFTIHNLEFGAGHIAKAMAYSDKSTTVSPTYSKEVAGNPAVSPHLRKFHGILNGIDPDIWDPYNDEFIPVSYISENVVEGKEQPRKLCSRGLD